MARQGLRHTYMRAPVHTGRTGQCPCCLKQHKTISNGTMTRHGWKEEGRVVGSFGNGFQFGACNGWGKRPLEQTDADAIAILVLLKDEIANARDALALHAGVGQLEYVHPFTVTHYDAKKRDVERDSYAKAMTEANLVFTLVNTQEKRHAARVYYVDATRFMVVVKRGQDSKDIDVNIHNVSVSIASWETLRRRQVMARESEIAAMEAQEKDIKAAIKHHKANPSTGSKAKATGPVMHYAVTMVTPQERQPGKTLAERTHTITACTFRKSVLCRSADKALVTCSRCRKHIEAEVKEKA